MSEYRFGSNNFALVSYDPKNCNILIERPKGGIAFSSEPPFIKADVYGYSRTLPLSSARRIHIEEQRTAVWEGVRAVYDNFFVGNRKLSFSVDTLIKYEYETGKIVFEVEVLDDEFGMVSEVHWPQSVEYNDSDKSGYTVIPMMQGILIPSKWHNSVLINDGRYYHHDGYMPWFGQCFDNKGYLMITRTAFDAGYCLEHIPSEKTRISNVWYPSLGKMSYRRVCEMQLFDKCDYNDFCASYRQYVIENGKFRSLKEKVLENPSLEKRIGTPIIQDYLLKSIDPSSIHYSEGHPEWNYHCFTFAQRLEQLKRLKQLGVDKAVMHLDGFSKYGYDSGHPDIFPPSEDIGGISGMKSFYEECRKIGFDIDLHDQYHDLFYNSPSFSAMQAIEDIENNMPLDDECFGGKQTFLCASLVMPYIRRNHRLLEENGLSPDGVHLATFAGGNIDECFNPLHRMTRKECIEYRREAFAYLRSKGIITCSDEPIDCMIDMLDFTIHAPYSLTPIKNDGISNGVSVPLFNLVYHDALIIPWFGRRKGGGWGIPNTDQAFTHAILNASHVSLDIDADAEQISRGLDCCKVAKDLAYTPMKRHDFLSDNKRIQCITYADGTVIEADFDQDITFIKK